MTLLISTFGAAVFTFMWYKGLPGNKYRLGLPSLMLWGASIMWLVDAVAEYLTLGAQYFSPAPADMLNDMFLGLSAVALTMAAWVVYLLAKNSRAVFEAISGAANRR